MIRIFLLALISVSFSVAANAQGFVERCEGNWKGTLHMYSKNELIDSVGISLTILPIGNQTGQWIWRTEYISEKMPLTKNYTLIQKKENEYLLDEGNGVVLINYVFENKMYSLFKVAKNWLTASYELVNNQLIFEVTSGVVSKQKTKGVTNYTIDFVQRAVFTKMNP